jgi:hypothetical protein
MRRLLLAALLVVAACAGPQERVDGVVVAVDGDLAGVASFEIVTGTGERLAFVPDPGLDAFDDGAPLSHLAEHLRTGVRVRITYEERDDRLVAVAVADAP